MREYRLALERWLHPAIQGNLAVALIHLERPLEAFRAIEGALRYGEVPFEDHVHRQLLAHKRLLERQLSSVELVSNQPGTIIVLDGARVVLSGRKQQLVLAGRHLIVGRLAGHLTMTREFIAVAGEVTTIEINLVPLDQAGGFERRWDRWKPWAVVGAGAATLAISGIIQLEASDNADEFERELASLCPDGCPESDLPRAVLDLRDRSKTQNRLAVTGFIVGSASIIAGGILVYLNQPRQLRLEESGKRLSLAPSIGPSDVGVAVIGRF